MENSEKCWYEEYCLKHENGCKDTCNRYQQIKEMIDYSGINPEQWIGKFKISTSNKVAYNQYTEIRDNIVNLIKNGMNLYICSSDIQCRKSTYSNRLILKYFDEIWAGNQSISRGYFLYVPSFLNSFLSFESQETNEYKEITKKLYEADVVVWDNFTNKKLMKNEQDLLETFIGHRFTFKKANIFNGLLPDNLYSSLGNVLAQRIEQCKRIELVKEGK